MYGSITPSSSIFRGQRLEFNLVRGASTIGRASEVSSASASGESNPPVRATSTSLAIMANGFSLRYFRSRNARQLAAFRASQAR